MRIRSGKRTALPPARLFLALFLAAAAVRADDYVRGLSASPEAKAYFAAVPVGLPETKVSATNAPDRGGDAAWFTEDGSISIPPGAMVEFSLAGRCMDPHLPAPDTGEPMQFVDVGKLVPPRLRTMYDNLLLRQARGDPAVLENNPQHLVWAIRTAGTDDPLANNLTDAQLRVLDECAGRRGAFLKYHEKMKRKNARKARKEGNSAGDGRIAVGNLSYDASDLSRTNAVRRVETHVETLTEMGRTSTVRTASDFRYGEIEDDLYSDISGDGGLSFTARILNASERRREFRAWDFAAQVGDGSREGGKRQRVTMEPPREFKLVRGAAVEDVEVDRSVSEAEVEGEAWQRLRGHVRHRRTERNGEYHSESQSDTRTDTRIRTETTTTVEEFPPARPVQPVPPPPPPEPIVIVRTNTVPHPVAERLDLRVAGLEWDGETEQGTLLVEIRSGSFRAAATRIRTHLSGLVREAADRFPPKDALPAGVAFALDAISIRDDDLCEVRFSVRAARKTR